MPKYKVGDEVCFMFNGEECWGEIYDVLTDPDEYVIEIQRENKDPEGAVFSVLEVDEYMVGENYE